MAMLCGASSIRDAIAFPKSATGRDLLIDAPSRVTEDRGECISVQLPESKELIISIKVLGMYEMHLILRVQQSQSIQMFSCTK